jgi:hypothetical protein
MFITAYESTKPFLWIAALVLLAVFPLIFVFGEICRITFTKEDNEDTSEFSIRKRQRLFYAALRSQQKSLTVFGVLALIICSGAAYIGWKDHTERKVTIADYTLSRLTVDEEQLRQWHGDEAGMPYVYSYMSSSGVPVFKDFSNPSKQVYRECALIFTEEQRPEGLHVDNIEVKVKITPRCSNYTTDGENVPLSTPKPTPTASPKASSAAKR